MTETQDALEDFLVVLADEGRGHGVDGRGLRKLEGSILEPVCANHRVLQIDVQLPVTKLRVMLHPVLGTLYRHRGHT